MAKKVPKFAWAIRTGGERDSYIGKFYFRIHYGSLPEDLRGCPMALFDNRASARIALQSMKPRGQRQAFPKARVVRVAIGVREIP